MEGILTEKEVMGTQILVFQAVAVVVAIMVVEEVTKLESLAIVIKQLAVAGHPTFQAMNTSIQIILSNLQIQKYS